MSASLAESLTSKKLIVKNISLNFIIQIVTILIGIFTVPSIIQGLGVDRFGILSIIWAVIGYSSLFDFGLGRALTQVVSSKLGAGLEEEIPSVIWTSMVLISGLGILAAALIFSLSGVIVDFIKVSPKYHQETLQSMQVMALTIPFLVWVIGMKGVLESYQKFDYTTWLRVPILITNYLIPIILLKFYPSLLGLVVVLAIGRISTCLGFLWAINKTVKNLASGMHFERQHFLSLFRFGSWLTVSNIINPFMAYLDRFLIAGMLSAQVVAYYATPYDVLSKMTIASGAVMSVIFPALATEFSRGSGRAKEFYARTLKLLALILIGPTLVCVIFAKPLITLWINGQFAEQSYLLAQVMALSFFISCMNTVPYSVIQALGRSDVTAKIYLFELPVFIGCLILSVQYFGIIGAPIAALVRFILDSILMHIFALRYIKKSQLTGPLPSANPA